MKRHRPGKPRGTARPRALEPAEIDRLYGLEPVFEPGDSPSGVITATESVSVRCPYCGEAVHTRVDLSAGETSYIEDCQVCCQPMELCIERTVEGALSAVTARRMD
jgi:hypothetical protein